MMYLIICTYNITFLIVAMVLITVCNLLSTLLEGVEVYTVCNIYTDLRLQPLRRQVTMRSNAQTDPNL